MTTYAAHIVTSEAVALGDPEIIVMTRDEGMGAEEIERFPLTELVPDGFDALSLLVDRGYRPVGDITYVDTGYTIQNVAKD